MDFKERVAQAVTSEENAGDFPKVIQGFKALGIIEYTYDVVRGVYVFRNQDNEHVELPLNGQPAMVAADSSEVALRAAINQAQAGQIDFTEFCELAGAAGIPYWVADLERMIVEYFDGLGNVIIAEPIPSA